MTRRPRAIQKGRAATPESAVLAGVLQLVLFHPIVAWAERMNTGAMPIDGRYVRFGFVGCPDILGQLKDGRILAIECKREGGSLTQAQSTFLARCEQFGGVSGVARSVDDAAAILERAKLPRV